MPNNRMYHAGDPIGYADLTSSYWQQHLIGAVGENQIERNGAMLFKEKG